jgi:hypothetical protein
LKVLLVTYHFPPDAEIGGVRPYRLARHWSEAGHEVFVLTVRPEFAESLDPGLGHDGVPEERVVRTRVDSTLRDVVLGAWRRRAGRHPASGDGPASGGGPAEPAARRSGARQWALSWLAFPDLHIGWYRPAVRAALDLLARQPVDVIVSTSPPRVAHLVAARLARRAALPWVMDFRDPWDMGWFKEGGDPPLQRAILRWLFRRTARRASALVANTPRLLREVRGQLVEPPPLSACVPNGFVVAPCPKDAPDPGRPPLTVGYFGQVSGRRTAVPFLEGVRLWLDRDPSASRARVRFVGPGFPAEQRAASSLGLDDLVAFAPPVPRAQALAMMHEPWVLLLLATGQPLQVPGKAYEYLATGRRVLALTERDGATAELLDGLPGATVCATPDEVAAALARFAREHAEGAPPTYDRAEVVEAGSYPRRAEAFARLLEEAARLRAPRG